MKTVGTLVALACLAACAAPAAETEPASAPAAPTAKAEPGAAGASTAPREQWCIRSVPDQDGNTVFLTMNLGYREWSGKSALPYLVHVNVASKATNPNGHPTDAEAAVLNRVEDGITASLLRKVPGQYVGRATTHGFRELMYYVSNADAAQGVLSALVKRPQERAWEYQIREDRGWKQIMPLLGAEPACL
jgi:hypothetical protein